MSMLRMALTACLAVAPVARALGPQRVARWRSLAYQGAQARFPAQALSGTALGGDQGHDHAHDPPITLLAGFLGAGKTTTLSNILQNDAGLKVGVIVNDLAAINVDANYIRGVVRTTEGAELVELDNGCVCCGEAAGRLGESIKTMLDSSRQRAAPFDHIVVELTGVADPRAVRLNLAMDGLAVDQVVTLVDAVSLPRLWNVEDAMVQRDDLTGGKVMFQADPCVSNRLVVELLTEQLEAASVILVNKDDMATPDEMRTSIEVASALNPEAKVLRTQFAQAPLETILPMKDACVAQGNEHTHDHHDHGAPWSNAKRSDGGHDHAHTHDHSSHASPTSSCGDPTCTDPTHDHSHVHEHALSVENIGFTSFVYRSERPMSFERLQDNVLNRWPLPKKDILSLGALTQPEVPQSELQGSPFANILRSKGFLWLDSAPTEPVMWSHAGCHMALSVIPHWMEASDDAGVASNEQELVVIGTNLDEAAIRAAFDSCLLTDEENTAFHRLREMAANNELRFNIGDEVEANTGTWEPGVIVDCDVPYRDLGRDMDGNAAYQIQLEDEEGTLIFAPRDVDAVVRTRR